MSYDGFSLGFLRKDKKTDEIFFTDAGLDRLAEMFKVGASVSEVADFLVIDEEILRAAIGKGGQANGVYRHATATFKMAVRHAQLVLAPRQSSMARHMGHHALGQPVDPTPVDDSLEQRVVGTLPDWEAAGTENWVEKFKPEKDSGSTIDKLRKMASEGEE